MKLGTHEYSYQSIEHDNFTVETLRRVHSHFVATSWMQLFSTTLDPR